MHEILRRLPAGARVLDLGSRDGSFDASNYPVRVVRADLEVPSGGHRDVFVCADAAALPFATASFDAIVANHSLEHFERLNEALEEMGRVLKPHGAIFVAVPDASTMADRLYRWLGRGGGHVNAFRWRDDLIALIEGPTRLRFAGGRTLRTSLAILNRKNQGGRIQRKLLLLGGGSETLLVLWSAISRIVDRLLGTRLSVYGWALYFGELGEAVDRGTWSNVCARCGAGYSSAWLENTGRVRRGRWLVRGYACPACGAWNIFTHDW
jgi:hypothetical protein